MAFSHTRSHPTCGSCSQDLRKFKLLVAATIFTCMAVHVLCFALIIDAIHVSWDNNQSKPHTKYAKCPSLARTACACLTSAHLSVLLVNTQWQNDALQTLTDMGDGQRYLQECVVYMRGLDQAYRGKGSNNTYVEEVAPVRVHSTQSKILLFSELDWRISNPPAVSLWHACIT